MEIAARTVFRVSCGGVRYGNAVDVGRIRGKLTIENTDRKMKGTNVPALGGQLTAYDASWRFPAALCLVTQAVRAIAIYIYHLCSSSRNS